MQHELNYPYTAFAQASQQADGFSIYVSVRRRAQASKQASKQQDNHYYIDNNLSYMSSTAQGNKCCPRKIRVRRGFSSAVTYCRTSQGIARVLPSTFESCHDSMTTCCYVASLRTRNVITWLQHSQSWDSLTGWS